MLVALEVFLGLTPKSQFLPGQSSFVLNGIFLPRNFALPPVCYNIKFVL